VLPFDGGYASAVLRTSPRPPAGPTIRGLTGGAAGGLPLRHGTFPHPTTKPLLNYTDAVADKPVRGPSRRDLQREVRAINNRRTGNHLRVQSARSAALPLVSGSRALVCCSIFDWTYVVPAASSGKINLKTKAGIGRPAITNGGSKGIISV